MFLSVPATFFSASARKKFNRISLLIPLPRFIDGDAIFPVECGFFLKSWSQFTGEFGSHFVIYPGIRI